MAVVRLEALAGLARAIMCAIPELRDRVCVGQADAGHAMTFPSLTIVPRGAWKFYPDQAEEVFEPSPNCVVMNVGTHQATLDVRLGAATLYQRYALEQKLVDLFLSTPLRPGVLLTQITACENLGPFVAAWEYEDDEWRDEKAFSQEFYSEIAITGTIPALVTRAGAYRIESLRLGLQETSTPSDQNLPSFAPPDVAVVQINADGTITAI